MKKLLTVCCAAVLSLGAVVSCTRTPENTPVLDRTIQESIQDTEYSLTYYYGPPLEDFTEEAVIHMKEAGFDTIPLQRFPWKRRRMKEAISLLEKHGLFAAVTEGRTNDLYYAKSIPSQEEIDAVVREIVEDYRDYGNIKEWILADEPRRDQFEVLARLVDAFHRIDPERKTFINLLPMYASYDMLRADSYEEYIDDFCRIVKPDYICFDYYDFIGITATEQRNGTFLKNMEIVKAAAQKYGLETRVIVLVTQHLHFSDLTPEEIAWQANLSLLYGMKGLSYFTYWVPDDSDYLDTKAMVGADGTRNQHYYDVQAENRVTRVLGNALYHTSCDRVFRLNTILADGVEDYQNYGALGAVSGEDFLISFYENGWFLVMNAHTVAGNDRTLTLKDVKSGLSWLNTETKRWEGAGTSSFIKADQDGYQITIPAGDAVLLRVT